MKTDFFVRLLTWSLTLCALSFGLGVAAQREYKYGRMFLFEARCSPDSLHFGCGEGLSTEPGNEDLYPVSYSQELPHR
jgi:hypothetical protein